MDVTDPANDGTSRPPPHAFELGLTLAGAISAGAYTAGVLDFLFQALDEWERHRGEPGIPAHRVVIKVITGASAGAITGALGAVALARGLHPVPMEPADREACYPTWLDQDQPYRCLLPSLWRSWVELPDMLQSGTAAGLLGLTDLPKNAPVCSLLDATVLERIKDSAIGAPDEPNQRSIKPPVPYVSSRLHLYMTLSNLRGIPYRVEFGRPENHFRMITHGDRVHYVIEGLGSGVTFDCNWLADDARSAASRLAVGTLPTGPGPLPDAWNEFGMAALASSAFPVGLAPRGLHYALGSYTDRKLPIPLPADMTIHPEFPVSLQEANARFAFQTVDGGVVNNNPFDYAQYALFGAAPKASDRTEGRRAIVMVAPFPEPPQIAPEGQPGPTVAAIVRALFPALINQARFRVTDLGPAYDTADYSRYLIAPTRRIPSQAQPQPGDAPAPAERYTIACGLLGGFGGFLDKAFRAHDFQLGRRNCQQFLRSSLTVRLADDVRAGSPGAGEVPVIPLLGTAAIAVPLPRWPQIGSGDLAGLHKGIAARLNKLADALIVGQTRSFWLRYGLRFGWGAFVGRPVRDFVNATILTDLVRRGQLRGYDPPQAAVAAVEASGHNRDDVAGVMAQLLAPGFRYRTVVGVATALALPPQAVAAALAALSEASVASHLRSWGGHGVWTTHGNRPPLLARLLGQIGLWRVATWWLEPKIG